MLFKFIIFAIFASLIYLFFTGRIGSKNKKKNEKIDATNMIECAKCGAYVAEKDALHANGNSYCSKACRDA